MLEITCWCSEYTDQRLSVVSDCCEWQHRFVWLKTCSTIIFSYIPSTDWNALVHLMWSSPSLPTKIVADKVGGSVEEWGERTWTILSEQFSPQSDWVRAPPLSDNTSTPPSSLTRLSPLRCTETEIISNSGDTARGFLTAHLYMINQQQEDEDLYQTLGDPLQW